MNTEATPTTQSEDPYVDWRTEMERISGDDNCPKCHGRGWLGLSKLPGGKTMLAACRCAKVSQYPVHEVVRRMVREEMSVLHSSVLGLKAQMSNEHETLINRMTFAVGELTLAWWKKIFRS